jgi:hypothetical protein
MNAHTKVQPHHLERGAYLYIRQSLDFPRKSGGLF